MDFSHDVRDYSFSVRFIYFQLLEKHGALKRSSDLPDDKRLCTLCGETGDGDNNTSARLVNITLL